MKKMRKERGLQLEQEIRALIRTKQDVNSVGTDDGVTLVGFSSAPLVSSPFLCETRDILRQDSAVRITAADILRQDSAVRMPAADILRQDSAVRVTAADILRQDSAVRLNHSPQKL